MKILILANNDVGLYRFRKELISKIINKGHKVFVSLPYGQLVEPLEDIGCEYIETSIDRRGINPIRDLLLMNRYIKIIKKTNPDIIITYTIKPNIYGGIASTILRKKIFVNITGLGTAFQKKGLVKSLVVFLYRISLKNAQAVIFENEANKDVFETYKICNPDKVHVLNGAGVNTDYYEYKEYPNNSVFKFLFVGRIMKEKGVEELLKAMKRLVDEGVKCSLDVVGACEESYSEKLYICEKEGWLNYYGFQNDVRPFIKKCDCFVLPSWHEGMANTNLENAASGRPVITSNIPGCKEAILDGVTGYLCTAKEVSSLYKVLKKIIALPRDERVKMGIAGRDYMKEKFDKEKVVKETLKILNI